MQRGEAFMNYEKILSSVYSPVSTIVHAVASQPAKNAGALTAVFGIKGAIPLIHGPMGCASLRKMNSFNISSLFPYTPCTNLTELDMVFGAGEKLTAAIVETYKRYRPSLIVVIPTCPSDMIGEDIESSVSAAKKQVNCEVVYSTGELIKGRPIGYHDVLYSIFDQLLPKDFKFKRVEKSVSFVSFPVHTSSNKFQELKEIMEDMGIRVNKVYFYKTDVSDIRKIVQSELIISDTSSPWLELLKKRFGVSLFITSTSSTLEEKNPYGIEHTASMLLKIAKILGLGEDARKVIEKKKRMAKERLSEEARALKGKKIAVVGGFFYGMGVLFVKDFQMRPYVLIYKTYGLENHGMSKEAIKKIIDMDIKFLEKQKIKPKVLINPSFEEEIKTLKAMDIELLISSGCDAFRYNAHGIKVFDSIKAYFEFLRPGFECAIKIARELKKEFKRSLRKPSLVSMLNYDPFETDFHPSWVKLERVWREVVEGADGGCIYG